MQVIKFLSRPGFIDDGNTPSSCTIRIGDIDPMTGEPITELTFNEIYRLIDHQIYINNKEIKNHVYYDAFTNEEGESTMDRNEEFSIPAADPFDSDADRILRLKEMADSLTGRMADVYEALLVKYAGGKEKISMTELARKWGVSVTQICKDREKIIRMIRELLS